jgi:cytochrome oxidase Cu insertion factor (SCO1/SenC/PrrC family)
VLAFAAVLGVIAGVVVALARPRAAPKLALPEFHGQASWAPGRRAAPGFALRDSTGATVALSDQRGKTVLLAFLDTRGNDAAAREGRLVAGVQQALGYTALPAFDIISLDPALDSAHRVAAVASRFGFRRGSYHWLVGPPAALAALWRRFGIGVPGRAGSSEAIYLIDARGFERVGYLFPFQPYAVARDVRTLQSEAP